MLSPASESKMADVGKAHDSQQQVDFNVDFDPANLLGVDEAAVEISLRGLIGDVVEIETKSFPDCQYVSCKVAGISLRLKSDGAGALKRVDVVFLYNEGIDGFKAYGATALPRGLDWSNVSKEVVTLLGEPSDKFGGGRMPVGIGYETLGIDIHFQNCSWDDAENPISFVGIFPAIEQTFDLCANCAKQARFHCGRCKLLRYCSSQCQKADWSRHQQVCMAASTLKLQAATCQPTSGQAIGEVGGANMLLDEMD